MSIAPEIIKAIRDSIKEESQPESVANRLIAWLDEMSSSELTNTEISEHLDTVRKSINIGTILEEV
ncbi:CxC ATPase DNA modification system associated small protein [Nostoc sp. UIC 10607]|uniref:CxC ATPase DNA modification system associated small protein n=1 Tax=Nostoc sp. UIC 10607 TaxID=3045935 RepID=UPI0039A224B7